MNINLRLDKIDKQVKRITYVDKSSAGVRMLRMLIHGGRDNGYQPPEEDKISKEEWQDLVKQEVIFTRRNGGDCQVPYISDKFLRELFSINSWRHL